MDEQTISGMAEAIRLTREGRVLDATALIQRNLGFSSPFVAPVTTPPPTDTVDAVYRVVEDPGTAGRQGSEPTGNGATIPSSESTSHRGRLLLPDGVTARGYRPHASDLPRTGRIGPVNRAGATIPSSSPDKAGRFLRESYANAAGARSYRLYIPRGYRGQEVPLLIMLHGCTQTADDFAVGTRMNLVAEEQTFLVAYPEQSRRANGGRCWNWFEATHQTRDTGEPSIIAGITRHIMAGYRIDPAQVYVAGMSAGGAMAAVMAATYPDLFAAAGIHSGLPVGSARSLPEAFRAMQGDSAVAPTERTSATRQPGTRAVPVIVFHGDRDQTVNPRNADRVLQQWATGGSAAGKLRVTTYPGRVPGGHAYTCTIYCDAGDEVVMEKWIIHEAGHAWSGGDAGGTFVDPRGPNASTEMVRFFREHPRQPRS